MRLWPSIRCQPEQQLDPALARTVEVLLRRCFAARRKMLRNTLAGLQPPEQLSALTAAAGIDLAATASGGGAGRLGRSGGGLESPQRLNPSHG